MFPSLGSFVSTLRTKRLSRRLSPHAGTSAWVTITSTCHSSLQSMTAAHSLAPLAFVASLLPIGLVESFVPSAVASATRASSTTIIPTRHLSATAPTNDGDNASAISARPKAIVFDLGKRDFCSRRFFIFCLVFLFRACSYSLTKVEG